MPDTDLVKLYSARILELTAHIPHTTRLTTPDATVRKRAPLCGSTVTVDISVSDGLVADYGQDVKACALGQAAAAIVGKEIIGCSLAEVRAARNALNKMLKEDGPTPPPPFEELEVLRPARDYKNRHASIMLTLDACAEAMEQILSPA